MVSEADYEKDLNEMGSLFTREHEKGWKIVTTDRAYSIMGPGGYGIRGAPLDSAALSWHQDYGAYGKKGFIGKGGGPLDLAFMSLMGSDEVNLSHQEAKFHMLNYLFGMKGNMGKRFKNVYGQVAADIQDFEHSVLWYDNIITNTEAWKVHISKAAEYTSQHAGGIIGDHIKEQYFSAGKREWAPNTMKTQHRKLEHQVAYASYPDVYMPFAHVPMWGITGRNTGLPMGWKAYTYKHGEWPKNAHVLKPVGFGEKGKDAFRKYGRPGLQRTAPFLIKRGRRGTSTMRGGGYAESQIPYLQKGKTKEGDPRTGKIYPPARRSGLMDIVAFLKPTSGYKNSPKNGGRGHVWVGDILEPFHMAPWVFNHETGYTTNRGAKVPARPFITPGVKNGVNDASRLFQTYIKDGERGIREGINISGGNIYNAYTTDALYEIVHWDAIHKKYSGQSGIRAPQQFTVYTSKFDDDMAKIRAKVEGSKKQTTALFNTRHIWWFLPPSKYYHYIGMGFDIASIVMGGFWSMGAVAAWMQAMTVGMAGARAGTPIPFTRKAQRRKFRKGLYTRAGYHRQGALGSGRKGR